jgi:formylglycine-generating enzyme required for sulfatase activity
VAPVGAYPANAFGLHDLIGNVWEWTQDCYRVPYPATPVDGTAVEVQGPCELRTVRGGSWRSHMFRQRSTWRGRDPEDRKSDIFGFRIARDLP